MSYPNTDSPVRPWHFPAFGEAIVSAAAVVVMVILMFVFWERLELQTGPRTYGIVMVAIFSSVAISNFRLASKIARRRIDMDKK